MQSFNSTAVLIDVLKIGATDLAVTLVMSLDGINFDIPPPMVMVGVTKHVVMLGGSTPVGPWEAVGGSNVENQTQYDTRVMKKGGAVAEPLGIVRAAPGGIET